MRFLVTYKTVDQSETGSITFNADGWPAALDSFARLTPQIPTLMRAVTITLVDD